ncbi:MAG: flavoredoxin [Pseudomonadota bacterium]|nr:flavoredoxin [Pseudomonadota bacterium]
MHPKSCKVNTAGLEMANPGGAAATWFTLWLGANGALDDSAKVVRGGANTAEKFSSGSGVKTHADGTLSGVSVNCANHKSIKELAQRIPNRHVGATTVGKIRNAGGDVIRKPSASNPDHCELHGITAKKAEELFTPTQINWK